MIAKILGLLLITICSLGVGYWLPHSWLGFTEVLGIASFIGCIVLSFQNQVTWLKKLGISLFFIGGFLTLFPVNAAYQFRSDSWGVWVVVVCLWTALGRVTYKQFSTLNKFLLAALLYTFVAIGIGLGYLGNIYFSF